MRNTKISVTLGAIVSSLIALLVFSPRFVYFGIPSDSVIHNLIYKILYLSGPIEQVGNLFLFIPLFLVTAHLFPTLRLRQVTLICVVSSGSVEIIQIWIPGRVSSFLDFFGNTIGVFAAQLFLIKFPKIRKRVRGAVQ